MYDEIKKEDIQQALNNKNEVLVFESIDSTNTYAKTHTLPDRTVIVANEQTNGRGRRGRGFFSPWASGVYMSLVLDFKNGCEDILKLTAISAVCVARAVECLSGKKAEIKWVNDILVNGKKVCGILCEGVTTRFGGKMIVGIGVNVRTIAFPEPLCDIAGSLCDDVTPRARYVGEIAKQFFEAGDNMEDACYINEYKRRCAVLGKRVTFYKNDIAKQGVAEDINEKGNLIVRLDDNTLETLSTGEITLRIN